MADGGGSTPKLKDSLNKEKQPTKERIVKSEYITLTLVWSWCFPKSSGQQYGKGLKVEIAFPYYYY